MMCWDGMFGEKRVEFDHSPKHCPHAYRTFRMWKGIAADLSYYCDMGDAPDEDIEKCAHDMSAARIADADEKHNPNAMVTRRLL